MVTTYHILLLVFVVVCANSDKPDCRGVAAKRAFNAPNELSLFIDPIKLKEEFKFYEAYLPQQRSRNVDKQGESVMKHQRREKSGGSFGYEEDELPFPYEYK